MFTEWPPEHQNLLQRYNLAALKHFTLILTAMKIIGQKIPDKITHAWQHKHLKLSIYINQHCVWKEWESTQLAKETYLHLPTDRCQSAVHQRTLNGGRESFEFTHLKNVTSKCLGSNHHTAACSSHTELTCRRTCTNCTALLSVKGQNPNPTPCRDVTS